MIAEAALPGTDHRLPALGALIADPRTRIVSVDCFDTILWRRVAEPVDAFVVLGEELIAHGLLDAGLDAEAFARLRISGERLARAKKERQAGTGEVFLAEIYAELPAHVSPLTIPELCARELDLERRLTVPDPELCAALSQLPAGVELLVLSDFYLSAGDLRTLIDRPECGAVAQARVLTSADLGIGKEGGLWPRLPGALGVAPDAIVHIGNNANADYVQPTAAGVRALHWAELSPELKQAKHAEIDFRLDNRRLMGLDHGVAALRGRARFRDHAVAAEHAGSWQTGVETLGPVLSGYADWVARRTAELGITRAICVMREGAFFQRLMDTGRAQSANPDLQSEIVWASRSAMVRASLVGLDRPAIEGLLSTPRPMSIAGAADVLGLDLDAFPTFAAVAAQAPHLSEDAGALQLFLDAVFESPEAVARIDARARQRQRNLIAHLRAALAGAQGPVAMLDIGWQGSNQERLHGLIDQAGLDVTLHGFYVSADTTPMDRLLRGVRIEGFVPGVDPGADGRQTAFYRNRVMLETLFLSEHGSTVEIDDAGDPVCAANRPSARQTAQVQAVQDGIIAYREHVLGYRAAGLGADIGALDGRGARTILERFVVAPTRREAELFGGIEHDDSHSNMETLTLIPAETDRWAQRLSGAQMDDERWERVWWSAGAQARRREDLASGVPGDVAPAGALRLGLLRAGATQHEQTQVLLRLGADGVTIGTWRGVGNGLHSVVLFPAITAGILRLDGVELFLATPSNGWRRSLWRWNAGDDPTRLALHDCEWIAPNLLSVRPGSQIAYTLPEPLPTPSWAQLEYHAGFMPAVDGTVRLQRHGGRLDVGFQPV